MCDCHAIAHLSTWTRWCAPAQYLKATLVQKAGASSLSPVDIVLLVCSGYALFAGLCIAH